MPCSAWMIGLRRVVRGSRGDELEMLGREIGSAHEQPPAFDFDFARSFDAGGFDELGNVASLGVVRFGLVRSQARFSWFKYSWPALSGRELLFRLH